MLRRYWFVFDPQTSPSRVKLGCGVTALNRDDALALLRQRLAVAGSRDRDDALALFANRLAENAPQAVQTCVEDVDVSTLDERHVVPNVGDVATRGIWFPRGL